MTTTAHPVVDPGRIPPSLADGLLTTKELAALVGVYESTPIVWRHRGVGPRFIKLGNSIRYLPADVDQWIRESRRLTDRGEDAR